MTPEKVVGQNYRSQGITPWNYVRARRARPMMSGTYPQKRSFDSWIMTKLRRVRFAFVDRNDSRVRHVTGVFALFKILQNNSGINLLLVVRTCNVYTLDTLLLIKYIHFITIRRL